MKHYVLIDKHVGYVWGEAKAESPIEACRKVDKELREFGRTYHQVSSGEWCDNRGGYDVREAPGDWDEVTIDRAIGLPRVALVNYEQQQQD